MFDYNLKVTKFLLGVTFDKVYSCRLMRVITNEPEKKLSDFQKLSKLFIPFRKCFISNWHTSADWQFLNLGEFQWVSHRDGNKSIESQSPQSMQVIPISYTGVYAGYEGCKNSGCRDRNVNFEDETRLKQRVWLLWQFYPILCILFTDVFLVRIEGKWSLITKLLLKTSCFYFVKTQT